MLGIGDQHDRPVQGQVLEDHARGIGHQDVGGPQKRRDVHRRVVDQMHMLITGGKPLPGRHPTRPELAGAGMGLDDDGQIFARAADQRRHPFAQHRRRGKGPVVGRGVKNRLAAVVSVRRKRQRITPKHRVVAGETGNPNPVLRQRPGGHDVVPRHGRGNTDVIGVPVRPLGEVAPRQAVADVERRRFRRQGL